MNRSEILFLYDIKDANPNGDPLDDNKPRLDEETEINIVTDVRLKRTIRDYLADYKGEEIFIKELRDDKGNLQYAEQRAADFSTKENKYDSIEEAKEDYKSNILDKCIDVRLFGFTIPKVQVNGKRSPVTLTGPVQFRMGRSLHKVEINHIKGTGAFASGSGKTQKTFREEYILPYSLIAFYGIINENAAKSTNLTDDDVNLLLDGIWNGTKNLISRSKFGQVPRMLLQIEYSDKNYFIGDLNNKLSISHNLDDDKQLRTINELKINASKLLDNLNSEKDKINKIYYKFDNNLEFKDCENILDKLKDIGIETEEIIF